MALTRLGLNQSINLATNTTGTLGYSGNGGSKVGQVIQATTSSAVNVASTSFTDTGLTVNITPTATSSKILVEVNQNIVTDIDTTAANSKIKLLRDSTTAVECR